MTIFLEILKYTGIVIGSLIGLIVIEMGIAVFAPWIRAPKQPLEIIPANAEPPEPPDCRENITITFQEENISGYLYLPEKKYQPAPCIVMAHGFGGTKDIILEQYALRYKKTGFVIPYRISSRIVRITRPALPLGSGSWGSE